jgi:nucleoside-diphosphate-sugar epimerase
MVKSYRRMRGQPFSLIDDKMKELLQTHWVCSGEKAKRDLGYEPKMSLREGIEETMHRYNEITR